MAAVILTTLPLGSFSIKLSSRVFSYRKGVAWLTPVSALAAAARESERGADRIGQVRLAHGRWSLCR